VVPETRFGTTKASVAGADWETRPFVPFERCTGVITGRSLAAEFIKAPAFARTFIVKRVRKLTTFVERSPVTTVVYGLAVKCCRPTQRIELGDRAEGQKLRQYAGNYHGNRRAPRDVDDRFVGDNVGDGFGACRVRECLRNATECSAGSDCNDRRRSFRRFFQHVEITDAGNR
jgi:hypothetical protein